MKTKKIICDKRKAFALLLGDTITVPGCARELIKKYDEFKTPIIAVEKVPKEKISSYGIIKGKEVEGGIHLVEDLVEKPSPEEAKGEVVNIGSYKEITILELAKLVRELTNSSSEIEFPPLPKDDSTRRCPDITKAKSF